LTELKINSIFSQEDRAYTMIRYRQTYSLVSLILLVCFLTTLIGVSAGAGHTCCGNCAKTALHHPMHTDSVLIANDCCPSGPACACTFESADARDLPAYSLIRVSTAGDNLSTGLAAIVSRTIPIQENRQSAISSILSENWPRSGPIYLANQSFLC